MSSSEEEEEDHLKELGEVKKYVDEQKVAGNRMLVSGWDDDTEGVEIETNPHRSKSTEIMWAAENGEIEVVKRLVEEDSSVVSVRDRDGYTPLHRACYNNHVKVVEYLLAAGADLSAKTEDKWQPLHSACHWNNTLCALRLIESGADINATTAGGQTPLHLAASHGASKDTLELLLLHPLIKAEVQNCAGETPYDIAKRSGVYYRLFEMFEPCINTIQDLRQFNQVTGTE